MKNYAKNLPFGLRRPRYIGLNSASNALLPSLKVFKEDYDLIYKQAEEIFSEYDICQWERNADGSFSCIVNRINSQKNNFRFIEKDGCCIYVCKHSKDLDDKVIRRNQHNSIKGCTVKSLKCKLHVCKYLRDSSNLNTIEAITKIDQLIDIFRQKYDILWECLSFGASKKNCIDFYKMYKDIFR
jgi:hypothetical protein